MLEWEHTACVWKTSLQVSWVIWILWRKETKEGEGEDTLQARERVWTYLHRLGVAEDFCMPRQQEHLIKHSSGEEADNGSKGGQGISPVKCKVTIQA